MFGNDWGILNMLDKSAEEAVAVSRAEEILALYAENKLSLTLVSENVGDSVACYVLQYPAGSFRAVFDLRYKLAELLGPLANVNYNADNNTMTVEVRNNICNDVRLQRLFDQGYKSTFSPLPIVVGRNLHRQSIMLNLQKLPHMLVVGERYSGRTEFLHTVIMSLVCRNTPQEVQLMLCAGGTDFACYNDLPFLWGEPVTSAQQTVKTICWLKQEAERRLARFVQTGTTDIRDYNGKVVADERFPYLVCVVGEFVHCIRDYRDFFLQSMQALLSIAQKAGIHLILSTQQVNRSVIFDELMMPLQVLFHCKSLGRFVVDKIPVNKLFGLGDGYLKDDRKHTVTRFQAPFVSSKEVARVVEYAKKIYKRVAPLQNLDASVELPTVKPVVTETRQWDELTKKALRFWLERQRGRASISSLQRHFCIGYVRAKKIMEALQEEGYLDRPSDNPFSAGGVQVLVTLDQLDELFPDLED